MLTVQNKKCNNGYHSLKLQMYDEEIVYLKNAVGKYKSSNIDLKVSNMSYYNSKC